jgi:hypothetical protein
VGQIQQVFDWARERVDKASWVADASFRTDVQPDRQSVAPQAVGEPDAEIVSSLAYEPTHPWHYLAAGDGAAPVPVTEIPPDEQAGRFIETDLPKNPKKRLMRIRELLDQERERLAADKQRYLDVIERGVDALSRYDREIAYTDAEIAVASTLALKYRHINLGLGRIAWLEEQVAIAAGNKLSGGSI